jgi:hypothetical protein
LTGANAEILAAMLALQGRGDVVDFITVTDELRRRASPVRASDVAARIEFAIAEAIVDVGALEEALREARHRALVDSMATALRLAVRAPACGFYETCGTIAADLAAVAAEA